MYSPNRQITNDHSIKNKSWIIQYLSKYNFTNKITATIFSIGTIEIVSAINIIEISNSLLILYTNPKYYFKQCCNYRIMHI